MKKLFVLFLGLCLLGCRAETTNTSKSSNSSSAVKEFTRVFEAKDETGLIKQSVTYEGKTFKTLLVEVPVDTTGHEGKVLASMSEEDLNHYGLAGLKQDSQLATLLDTEGVDVSLKKPSEQTVHVNIRFDIQRVDFKKLEKLPRFEYVGLLKHMTPAMYIEAIQEEGFKEIK